MEVEIHVEEWKQKFSKAGTVEKFQLVKQLLAVRSKFLGKASNFNCSSSQFLNSFFPCSLC